MPPVEYYTPGMVTWVACTNGNYPQGAVESGWDNGARLYVARAHHNGALVPGKFHSGHHTCYISWGGKEIPVAAYEVLKASPGVLQWAAASRGQLVTHAVVGGNSEMGEKLYIGRVRYRGTVTSGKIQPSHGCCYFPYGGREMDSKTYEILHG